MTNKHVVRGCANTHLLVPYIYTGEEAFERRSFDITIADGEGCWIMHPEDDVDLCALPLMGVIERTLTHDPCAQHVTLDVPLIPNQDELNKLSPFEDVIMVGYPIGLIDEVHNAPLMRKGITATHPRYDYNGDAVFIIDCACFPGSSGSPVFLLDNGPYVEDGVLSLGQRRFKFLGILFSGPVQSVTGEINVVNVPTNQRLVADTKIPTNLGNVIKSRKLAELGDLLWKMAGPGL